MEPTNLSVAEQLRNQLVGSHPEWADSLRLDTSSDLPILRLPLPHSPTHELTIEVQRTEAIVFYSDGRPPGPAEELFAWGGQYSLNEGLDAVCVHIDELVRGDVILVREQLSGIMQILRRHERDSVLCFVERKDYERWSPRRRQRARVWSWAEHRWGERPGASLTD